MQKSHYNSNYDVKMYLVLSTKYRKECISPDIADRLSAITAEFCNKYDVQMIEYHPYDDHIVVLLNTHPNITPAKFVNSLKTVTSRLLRKEFSAHFEEFYSEPVLWSRGYCLLSSGSVNEKVINDYLVRQKVSD